MTQKIIITIEPIPDSQFKINFDFEPALKANNDLANMSGMDLALQMMTNKLAAQIFEAAQNLDKDETLPA